MVDRHPSKSIVNLGSASVDNVSSGWQSTMSSRKECNIYIMFLISKLCSMFKKNSMKYTTARHSFGVAGKIAFVLWSHGQRRCQQWDLHWSVYFYKRAHEYPVLDRRPGSNVLVPGTGKSHQNTSAGKFDPERAVWNCWLLVLFNGVILYDVTTHTTTLPATSPPLSMALSVNIFNKFI